jgi:DNA-binding CsgD family transcriptional regulator
LAAASNGKHTGRRRAQESSAPRYLDGVVLLDIGLKVLGFDEGAGTILKECRQPESETDGLLEVPQEILAALQNRDSADPLARKLRIQLGSNMYICRIHVAGRSVVGFPGEVIVVHLVREVSMNDALTRISIEYHLTLREEQTLRGVLSGLTSKEVAEEMKISPNTVKAFLRLVMGKMGVSSRTGIVAKLFEPNGRG